MNEFTEEAWQGVSSLIALITDAPACKQRMDELVKARADVQAKIDEHASLGDERAEVNRMRSAADGRVKEAERWNEQLKAKEKDLANRLGVASDRERNTITAESNVKFLDGKLGERENGLAHREAALAEREKAAQQTLAKAQTLMADYDEAKHRAALKLAS